MRQRPPEQDDDARAATDRWVARVNKAAREIDETAASIHPSAWPETLQHQREAFKKLAAGGER